MFDQRSLRRDHGPLSSILKFSGWMLQCFVDEVRPGPCQKVNAFFFVFTACFFYLLLGCISLYTFLNCKTNSGFGDRHT